MKTRRPATTALGILRRQTNLRFGLCPSPYSSRDMRHAPDADLIRLSTLHALSDRSRVPDQSHTLDQTFQPIPSAHRFNVFDSARTWSSRLGAFRASGLAPGLLVIRARVLRPWGSQFVKEHPAAVFISIEEHLRATHWAVGIWRDHPRGGGGPSARVT